MSKAFRIVALVFLVLAMTFGLIAFVAFPSMLSLAQSHPEFGEPVMIFVATWAIATITSLIGMVMTAVAMAKSNPKIPAAVALVCSMVTFVGAICAWLVPMIINPAWFASPFGFYGWQLVLFSPAVAVLALIALIMLGLTVTSTKASRGA